MRLLIVTYGTEGSTRPLVGLSRALLDEDHDVRLLAERSTLRSARSQGILVEALDGDLRAALEAALFPSPVPETNGSGHPPAEKIFAQTLIQIARDNMASWMRAILHHAQSADAILFSGIAGYAALCVAECLELPAIDLGLCPETATRHFPSPHLSIALSQRLPEWLNRASYHWTRLRLWKRLRDPVNEARREICRLDGNFRIQRDLPTLYGLSHYLMPQIDDWPESCKICGPWSIRSGVWEPPPPLADFLDAGPPPVYIGFGSMSAFVPDSLLSSLADAMRNRRVIFSPGWSRIDTAQLPENFFLVGDMPHDWLFQRAAMIVHHGGSGTSHTAVRAGVPSVVIPFAGNQLFWAERLHTVGIAPKAVPFAQIDTPLLTKMIAHAEQPSTRERVQVFASAMAMEEGTSYAIRHIRRLVESRNGNGAREYTRFP